MVAIVSLETVLLLLVGILLAGVLRSHSEILRLARLYTESEAVPTGYLAPSSERPRLTEAVPVIGETLAGEAVTVTFDRAAPQSTLLAFLSTGCLGCEAIWDTLANGSDLGLPPATRVLVVAKSSTEESPSRLTKLAPAPHDVVLSSDAWLDYRVPQSPYFVYIDRDTGRVAGEGSAASWAQMVDLLSLGLDDSNELAAQARTLADERALSVPGEL